MVASKLSKIVIALALIFSGEGFLMSEPKIIRVKDFGAVPGMSNAAPGIQKALNQAAALGEPAVVLFEPGVYDLDVPGKDSDYALSLKNAKDVSLNGNGAMLRIRNPAIGGVLLSAGRNVSMRSFLI
ncbi:MAG: hypothetical protein JNM63_19230, partial [Spirochaetia bacterium]|nr:hypothetical protein [Spirochaetia bacterium]